MMNHMCNLIFTIWKIFYYFQKNNSFSVWKKIVRFLEKLVFIHRNSWCYGQMLYRNNFRSSFRWHIGHKKSEKVQFRDTNQFHGKNENFHFIREIDLCKCINIILLHYFLFLVHWLVAFYCSILKVSVRHWLNFYNLIFS